MSVDITKYVGGGLTVAAIGVGAGITIWALNTPLAKALMGLLNAAEAALGGLLDSPLGQLAMALVALGVGGAVLFAVASFLKDRNTRRQGMETVNERDLADGRSPRYTDRDFDTINTRKETGSDTLDAAVTAGAVAKQVNKLSEMNRAKLAEVELRMDVARANLDAMLVKKGSVDVDELADGIREFEAVDALRYETRKSVLGEIAAAA